jgi:hypothetical protein
VPETPPETAISWAVGRKYRSGGLGIDKSPVRPSCWNDGGGAQVLRLLILAIAATFRPKALLIAENLCLREQLVVLQRRQPRPCLRNADLRFWILASRWFSDWRRPLLIVKPETVLGWQRAGWRAYWTWRSSRQARGGRPAIRGELQALIGRMAAENGKCSTAPSDAAGYGIDLKVASSGSWAREICITCDGCHRS